MLDESQSLIVIEQLKDRGTQFETHNQRNSRKSNAVKATLKASVNKNLASSGITLPTLICTSEPCKSRECSFDSYIRHEVLNGTGFSIKLMQLDTLRTFGSYPSPSEALDSSRSNRRLHRAVQTVGLVGLPPPQLQEHHHAAQHLKRTWLYEHWSANASNRQPRMVR